MPDPLNIKCPIPTRECEPQSPFGNLSSEAPDQEVAILRGTGITWFKPPLGSNYGEVFTASYCTVPIGDNLVAVQFPFGEECPDYYGEWPTWTLPEEEPGGDPVSRPVFSNQAQSYTATCPDGSQFTYTVKAGTYIAPTQALANLMALSKARQEASIQRVCFIQSIPTACIDQPYSGLILISTAPFVPVGNANVLREFTWTVVSGEVPPGLLYEEGTDTRFFLFSGIAAEAGNFSFILKAQDQFGNFMTHQFTIGVMEITTTGLAVGLVGSSYNYQLDVDGGADPRVWSVVSGALPDGLTLSEDGLISGVPTENGDFVVTFGVTSGGTTCAKPLLLQIGEVTCPSFVNTFVTGASNVFSGVYGEFEDTMMVDQQWLYFNTGLASMTIIATDTDGNPEGSLNFPGFLGSQLNMAFSNSREELYVLCAAGAVKHLKVLDAETLAQLHDESLGAYEIGKMSLNTTTGLIVACGSSGGSSSIIVFNPATYSVIHTNTSANISNNGIPTYAPSQSAYFCTADDSGPNRSYVRKFNSSLTLLNTLTINNSVQSFGVVYSPVSDQIYAVYKEDTTNDIYVAIVNPATNALLGTIATGATGTPISVDYDSGQNLLVITLTGTLILVDLTNDALLCVISDAFIANCYQVAIDTGNNQKSVTSQISGSVKVYGNP